MTTATSSPLYKAVTQTWDAENSKWSPETVIALSADWNHVCELSDKYIGENQLTILEDGCSPCGKFFVDVMDASI